MVKYNVEQLEVINSKEGAFAVLASAGSGKSTVLVERVGRLIESGVNSDEIAVVTFTDNSSQDLKSKFKKKKIEGITTGTFHSICKRILISEGIDTSKQLAPYQIENEFRKIDEKVKFKDVMSFIGYQKNNGIGVNDDFIEKESDYTENELRDFYKSYEELKTRQHALDFEDWLILTVDVLNKKPNRYTFEYILVDESQDNNSIQNKLMKLLCPKGNVMAIGDFRQAIYGFRGSNPELFMNFKNQYKNAKVINLSMNYRSTKNVVENSNSFISKYYGDYEFYKDSVSSNKNNGNINLNTNCDKNEEAENIVEQIKEDLKNGVKPNDIAVLYRNNSNSFNIENELKKNNISYFISSTDGNFFNRKEIACVMCMLRLIDNPNDNIAYDTVFSTRTYPFTYMKNTIRDKIRDLSAIKNISLYEASDMVKTETSNQRKSIDTFNDMITQLIIQHKKGVKLEVLVTNILTLLRMNSYIEDKYEGEQLEERMESITALKSFIRDNTLESFLKFVYGSGKSQKKCSKDDITLTTIHKSKGLEWKSVYLVGIQDGKFPSDRSNDILEEARVMYVAVTRAKENLTVSQIYEGNRFVNEYFEKTIN